MSGGSHPPDAPGPIGGPHGGNLVALAAHAGRSPETLLDFSANINPLGAPPAVRSALLGAIDFLDRYPDPACTELTAAIAEHLGTDPARVIAGNGAEQIVWWLPRLLGAKRILTAAPSYVDYRRSAEVWGLPVEHLRLDAADGFALDLSRLTGLVRAGDLVWVGQPNNPTGCLADPNALRAAALSHPQTWWAVDEAFIDFVEGGISAADWGHENLIVVRSMTKLFALAGLRLGYAVMAPRLARGLGALMPPWSVSSLAQAVGAAVLRAPDLPDFVGRTQRVVGQARRGLVQGLSALGADVHEGAANYLLMRLPDGAPAGTAIAERLLLDEGIAVRVCRNYAGLDDRYLRVAVRMPQDNARLLVVLGALLDGTAKS